jgi:DNA invertase Pin-like site-specific DNA recombinase
VTVQQLRAAVYARYSTEQQSAASIDDQFRVCDRIAERHGFRVVARFEDAGISGGTTRRPGYQSLLTAARTRQFDVIIAEDTSRLWRQQAEQWRAIAELSDLGLHIVTHDADTRSENYKLLLSIHGAMADVYRDQIAYRTKRGLEGRARTGKSAGVRHTDTSLHGTAPPASARFTLSKLKPCAESSNGTLWVNHRAGSQRNSIVLLFPPPAHSGIGLLSDSMQSEGAVGFQRRSTGIEGAVPVS